jgi:tetratricopeptide (TPR) repeat protein
MPARVRAPFVLAYRHQTEMTSPNVTRRPGSGDGLDSFADWFQLYSRQISWAVLVLAAIAGGGWFYMRSKNLKAERAEKALFVAEQSIPGNLPLAESDLRKLIVRYDGTQAAMQAQLALAQLLYDQGKYQEGVAELKKAVPKLESSKDFASSAHLLQAAGYEQLKKFLEAGNEYMSAAKTARFDSDRQRYESFAARSFQLGGRVEDAKRIWTRLAADSKGTVAGEARVRLGELTATPQPKS